jgi:hypothetical protein
MGAESDYGGSVYTAVLSPDAKRLTRGVWKETERSSDEKEKRTVSLVNPENEETSVILPSLGPLYACPLARSTGE